jgi:hypothetical protein
MLYTTQALSENEAHIITNTDTLHIPIKVVNSCFGNGAERISRNPQLLLMGAQILNIFYVIIFPVMVIPCHGHFKGHRTMVSEGVSSMRVNVVGTFVSVPNIVSGNPLRSIPETI